MSVADFYLLARTLDFKDLVGSAELAEFLVGFAVHLEVPSTCLSDFDEDGIIVFDTHVLDSFIIIFIAF